MTRYNGNLEIQYAASTFLGGLSPASRSLLKTLWTERAFDQGRMILSHEDDSAEVMFLLRGAARVANFSGRGREVSFSAVAEGDCFGEFGMIDGAERSASVIAMQDCIVGGVPVAAFRDVLQQQPEISMAMMQSLVRKLRDLTRRVSEFTALRADDRIRLEVLRMFQAQAGPDGSAYIAKPPTHAAIAAFVFTNREAVAREHGRMKRAGLIHSRGRALFVPSIDRLAEYTRNQADTRD